MNYPFDLTVHVYRRPHMRCESLEYELYLGRRVLCQIFDDERVDPEVTELFLSFPERWMNIVEERSLYDRLARFCPNLKSVFIKTQSVYIIQSTRPENLRILHSEEEQNGAVLPQEAPTGRLWFKNAGNVVNASTISIL